MNNKVFFISAFLLNISFVSLSYAENITKNTARMQAMDKITGRVSVINVPVNGEITFGSLSVIARSCKTRPAEETPDNFAFIDIADKSLKGDMENVFKGWMISSSPATNALEHPIYDIWLLQCIDTDLSDKNILSEQQLAERDNLPMTYTKPISSENNIQEQELSVNHDAIIDEMTAEQQPEITPEEMLLSNKFLFNEDEDEPEDEIEILETSDASSQTEIISENDQN